MRLSEDRQSAGRRRRDERAPLALSRRAAGSPLEAASLASLQGTIGNRAVATLVARRLDEAGLAPRPTSVLVQREYTPTRKEGHDFKRWIVIRWDQPEDMVGDITAQITKWCSSHVQAEKLSSSVKYVDFVRLRDQFKSADEAIAKHGSFEQAAANSQAATRAQPLEQTKAKVADRHAETKKKIKSAGFNPTDFTEDELVLIETSKDQPGVGWDKAIAEARAAKTEKENTARLGAERAAKYATAKTTGDARFTDPLAKRVWGAAHGLAISGSSSSGNPNITLGGEPVARDEALAAVRQWRANRTIAAGLVEELHVPGGDEPIEDKANRALNPDAERRYQADFCSYWSNTKVNVHVNVKTSTMS